MKVLVVYYSLYGHVLQMAQAVVKGVESVPGVEVVLRRVQEFPDVEEAMSRHPHAQEVWDRQKDIPVCTLDDLKAADGILFGTPTRYGNMTAQMKRLFDSTVQLWSEGALEGKPAGLFTSTATIHGGQETTCFTMMAPLLHLGFIIVGVPYSTPGMLHTEGRGGTPYGASTVAGQKNELKPAPEDLDIAKALGKRVAEITKKLRT
ncbi:MAG: NAD(P)H:quinone oxidoreductase [Deltaproteobacteria bacterium]|nr:NAD(P)H:quinone oxidoreductase [Deltaproteobacteria bacterium]